MGKILEQYYNYARKKGAYVLRMRLSIKTGWSTSQARKLNDTKANIQKVRSALQELLNPNDIPEFK